MSIEMPKIEPIMAMTNPLFDF